MTSFRDCVRWSLLLLAFAGLGASAQDAPGSLGSGPLAHPKALSAQVPTAPAQPIAPAVPPRSNFDPAMFLKPVPAAQLSFIKGYDGAPSGQLYRDKEFRKVLKSIVPDCMFHYGRDRGLGESLDLELEGSATPVQVLHGRYALLSGTMDHMLGGRAFVWIDLQDGIGLGGFVFFPTNGEPAPAMNIFSRQVKEDYIAMSELPPGFVDDLVQWSTATGLPPLTVRYFLTGENRKIMLEHDEDFCRSWDGTALPPESGCEQEAADAADVDLTAAYYVDATHHATNATAWMLNPEQVSFIEVRDSRCRVGPDPLGCRIRLTREKIAVVVKHPPIVIRH